MLDMFFGHTFDSGRHQRIASKGRTPAVQQENHTPPGTNSSLLKIDVLEYLLSLTGRSTFHGRTGTGFVFCVPKCVDFNIAPFGAIIILVASTFIFILITFTQGKPQVGKKSCRFMHHSHHSHLSFSSFYRILKGFFSAEGRGDPNHLPGGISCFFPYDFAKVFLKEKVPTSHSTVTSIILKHVRLQLHCLTISPSSCGSHPRCRLVGCCG